MPVHPRYEHEVVNHSRNFVDPLTGAHTNNVECFWKNAKQRLKSMAGVHDTMLSGHLNEFLWRERWGKN
ncbi:Putative LOC101846883, partial [Caligus rogercresseyi]